MDAFKAAQDKFNRQKLERDTDLWVPAGRYELKREVIWKDRPAYTEKALREADAKKAG